jgi:hypothetical protein
VTFSANVSRTARTGKAVVPTGHVQFVVDGLDFGDPVPLDKKGAARWTTAFDRPGSVSVTARYLPTAGSPLLPSSSLEEGHAVK